LDQRAFRIGPAPIVRKALRPAEIGGENLARIGVRLLRSTGRHEARRSAAEIDPLVWSGRASQENFVDLSALRSCINVSGLCLERVLLRTIMDISVHAISLADRPRTGHLGHQCSHASGRPISPSSHPLADLGGQTETRQSYVIDSSSFCAVPSFVPCGRSFVSACACRRTPRTADESATTFVRLQPLAPAAKYVCA
jgi:hypothetical protein